MSTVNARGDATRRSGSSRPSRRDDHPSSPTQGNPRVQNGRRARRSCIVLLAAVHLSSCSNAPSSRLAISEQLPSYESAVSMIARRQAVDDSIADPGARSILLTANRRTDQVFLLLHGMTDSPRQFEAFAYLLRGDGNNVYVPRLPQHGLRGGNVGALAALTAAQLRAVADSVVTEASGLADSVVVVGLSMGGVIGAWIVQQRKVSRAVLIAPAIGVGRIPSLLQRPIIGLADRLPNVTRRTLPDTSRPDREMGFSSRAAAEILELGAEVLRQAESQPPKTMRVTMLLNANDRTVRESASEALAAAWAAHGAGVSIFELPDSLRLPHNVIDAYRGVSRGDAVLHLLARARLRPAANQSGSVDTATITGRHTRLLRQPQRVNTISRGPTRSRCARCDGRAEGNNTQRGLASLRAVIDSGTSSS